MDSTTTRKCLSCGSNVEEFQYQMRAADEAHTSVWTCRMCPLDPSRVRFSDPGLATELSFPRVTHRRVASDSKCVTPESTSSSVHVEMFLTEVPADFSAVSPTDNLRYPCSMRLGERSQAIRAHYYMAGAYSGRTVSLKKTDRVSPRCRLHKVEVCDMSPEKCPDGVEKDGVVREAETWSGSKVFVYSRDVGMRRVHSAVVVLNQCTDESVRRGLVLLHSLQQRWPSIYNYVSKDQLASLNNVSPRAWDSRRVQKSGSLYSPKVDGERAYVLIYQKVAYVFRKGKGYPHIAWKVLVGEHSMSSPVVVDVENTMSHGCFLIDMLTDSKALLSPRDREFSWSLSEFRKVKENLGIDFINMKPCFDTLREAELFSASTPYPTDGVIAMWKGSTTARKMKQERSIELLLRHGGSLVTSDGDTVFATAPIPAGISPGEIVEVRFSLCSSGKSVLSRPLFKRVDKAAANSTSAVRSVLSSFNSVQRDDETRRRNVLMWCESLKASLFYQAISWNPLKRVVLDVGTGTGQSLDVLSPDRGVSYILVEPDARKCEMLKRRTGVSKILVEPRDLLSSVRHLKSGSQTYVVLNCTLSDVISDEQLMISVKDEISVVTAFFSAHYVIPELYDISTYWSIPVMGCFYPYDGVTVGGTLVDSLGVRMRRDTERGCSVRWGGDREYREPYTTVQEYQSFSSVMAASDVLQPPSQELDEDVSSICSKVHVLMSFQ